MSIQKATRRSGASASSGYMAMDRTPPGTPNPVDIHVGGRVRLRRTLLGLSQEKLGQSVQLTFQQIQKYERGTNRIGASRLYQLGRILDVPVSYFFEDIPSEVTGEGRGRKKKTASSDQDGSEGDPLSRRETLELVRAYYRIQNPKVRKRLFELTKSIAKMGDD